MKIAHLVSLLGVLVITQMVACTKGCQSTPEPHKKAITLFSSISLAASSRSLFSSLKFTQKDMLSELKERMQKSRLFRFLPKGQKKCKKCYAMRVSLRLNSSLIQIPRDGRPLRFHLIGQLHFQFLPGFKEGRAFSVSEFLNKIYSYSEPEEDMHKRNWIRGKIRSKAKPLLKTLWENGLETLVTHGALQTKSSDTLVELLQDRQNATRVRRQAIRILGIRQFKPAFPIALGTLKEKNYSLLRDTIDSLMRYRDRKAVVPLIECARTKNSPLFAAQVISALAELGGDQAKSYLSTLASAHPNRRIRQTAREAYGELQGEH